jgi:uncharacterized protein (DUF58 family)
MTTADPTSRVTDLLTNGQLARLERMRINAARLFTNRSRGEHLSSRGGTSNEFSDYRDYAAGDDIRYVDWNVFARLQRPYLKLYRQEEEMHVVVLVDASSSMMFEGKLDRARQLAASFGLMGLMNAEMVSVHAFNQRGDRTASVGPKRGRVALNQVFRFIESLEGGGDGPVDDGVESLLREHRGRGVVILLSDFLTTGDIKRSLNTLFAKGLEVFAVQILGPTEIDPEVAGDLRLVDSETEHTLDVSSARDLIHLYHEYLDNMRLDLEAMCKQRRGRFLSIDAQEDLDGVLFDLMRRRGWVR